jgi:hypothetical protein
VICDRLIKGDAFSDRLPASVQLSRTLESNRSDEPTRASKKSQESIVFDSTETDLHFVSLSDFARDRDAKIELIRPDVGNRRMTGHRPMNDSLCQNLRLLDRARPMLESRVFGIVRILPTRTIAQRENTRSPRIPRRIANDTVIDFEPGALDPLRLRSRTDANHDNIRRQSRSIGKSDRRDTLLSIESVDAYIQMEDHALLPMPCGNALTQNRAQTSNQRRRKWVDNGHLETHRATARRNFHPDEPGTHDDNALRLLDFGAQQVGIGQCPKTDHTGQILTKGQLPSTSPGCQDNHVSRLQAFAAHEFQAKRIGVEGHRLTAELPDNVEIADLTAPQRELLVRPITGQKLFGKRRPVIGPLRLTANSRDSTDIAFTAKRLDDSQTRKRSTYDDKMIVHELKFLDCS